MNINVDSKKLHEFAAYASDFSKNINTECSELNSATNRLAQSMDEDDMIDIRRLTKDISRILDAGGPALKDLNDRVEAYANFVERLNAIAKG